MRTLLILLLCLAQLLLLGGRNGVQANFREVEELLVLQTMGVDRTRDGLRLSLASSGGNAGSPVRLEATGASISAALERMRESSGEEELFCAHVKRLLLGEAQAEAGVREALDYVSASPELRLDLPVYVLRDAEARDAVLGVGDGEKGVCDALDAVERNAKKRGDLILTSAADLLQSEARHGSALVCALSLRPSSERGEEALTSLVPDGYAVLRGGKLCRMLTAEQAVAVGILKNEPGLSDLTLPLGPGSVAEIELLGGKSRVEPVLGEDGALAGLRVHAQLSASLLETQGRTPRGGERDMDALTAALEQELAARLSAVLQISKELKADFLGLSSLLPAELVGPSEADFAQRLPELSLEISVGARLSHDSDKRGT